MRSIFEELFYGNICPNTDCRSHDEETKQLMGYIADHHDNLLSTLNEKQKETLEKFEIATTSSSISTSASCLHMLLSLVRKSHSKSYMKPNNAILRRNLFPPFFYCFVVCQKRHNGWCRINTLDTKNTQTQINYSVPNLSQRRCYHICEKTKRRKGYEKF